MLDDIDWDADGLAEILDDIDWLGELPPPNVTVAVFEPSYSSTSIALKRSQK